MINALAAVELEKVMSDISERCYCAGWLNGTEYVLWKAMTENKPADWGQDKITSRDIKLLKKLSKESGCWAAFSDEYNSQVLITIADWELHYEGKMEWPHKT